MNIFLSYASAQRALAEELCHRLQVAGHEVFFDREDLPAGRSYDDHIFQAIEACELFVFLVTPESVADGRYTRTELKVAARRWPTPDWHVLPVLAAPTPIDTVPPYLRALNLLQPEGNLAAEVLLEVQARWRLHGQAPSVTPAGSPALPPTPAPPAATVPTAARPEPASAADRPPHYGGLRLRFRREADGRYHVQVDPPEGAGDALAGDATRDAPTSALLTIDPAALERGLWQGAVAIEGHARRGLPPGEDATRLPGAAGVRDTGTALHALLFGSSLGDTLRERLRAVDPQRGQGLRLVLDTTEAPELARLPWEVVYSPQDEDFVFSDRFKPLVRRLALDAPPPVLAVAPPLRLLVAVASPADRPELQVGDELGHLDGALAALVADGRLQTERLDHTALERLDDALLRWRPHVLHFIGHGDFDGDEGRLLLESAAGEGTSTPIAGRRLAVLLRNHLASLRLVFLNSCLGAAAAPHAAFGGVAQSLVRRGMPAVVAMQFPVPDTQAVGLARHFYRYVAAGQPVDAALTSARAFLYARGDEVCWAAPVLYLNAEDGRLFDLSAPPDDATSPKGIGPGSGPDAALDVAEFEALLKKSFGPGAEEAADGAQPVITRAEEVPRGAAPGPARAPDPFAPGPAPTPDRALPPPTAPRAPDAARPAERGRRMPVALVATLAIAVLLGAAAWVFLGGGTPLPSRDPIEPTGPVTGAPGSGGAPNEGQQPPAPQRPAPAPAPTLPAPPPAPPPPPPPPPVVEPGVAARVAPAMRPASREAIERADAQLRAGDAAGAAQTLDRLRRGDPAALSARLLAGAQAPLADELLRAAEQAQARGDLDLAASLSRTLQAMGPLAPDRQRRLAALPPVRDSVVVAGRRPLALPNAVAGPHGGLAVTLRRGDTLWGLARRFLGDGRRWPDLVAAHNAMADAAGVPRIDTPDRLAVGQRLLLPPDPATGQARAAYHVAPGESLWRIARRLYGDGQRWRHLQQVNRLPDPDRLVPGQVLEVTPLR